MLCANCTAFAGYHCADMHDDIWNDFRPVQTVLFELEVENNKKYIYSVTQTGLRYAILSNKRNCILLMQLPAIKSLFLTSVMRTSSRYALCKLHDICSISLC